MTRGTMAFGLLFAAVLASRAPSQGALDRARAALAKADYALARAALQDVLAQDAAVRNREVSASLSVFKDAGAVDEWLKAAGPWVSGHPDDAMILFYRGVLSQELKHLRRADEDLGRARALAPGDPAVQLYWAWNATDPKESLERAKGASFEGVDAFRAEREAKLAADPGGARFIAGLIGAALAALTAAVLWRAGEAVRKLDRAPDLDRRASPGSEKP